MNTIKFSHDYEKIPLNAKDTKNAMLLEVFTSHLDELSQGFIEYDTKIEGRNEYYTLPNSKLLILLIKIGHNQIFTTVRRWTPEKEAYYRSIRGQQVKIEVQK